MEYKKYQHVEKLGREECEGVLDGMVYCFPKIDGSNGCIFLGKAFAIAQDKGFMVHLFEAGEGDHIHCFVSAPPKLSITDIVKYLKGITGRKLFERYQELREQLWKGQLWNHSYYVETIGSVSEENIRRYIEHQSKQY